MEFPNPGQEESSDIDAIIVKADEIDEAGADISTISPTNSHSESDFNNRIESRRAQDAQTIGSPKILANAVPSPPRPNSRPILRREGSTPAPPQQPPPPAPPRQQEESNPTDSLSLLQLRRLVGDLPKIEPTAYAYEYEETRSFPEELQEWFQYSEEERYMLLRAKEGFEEQWEYTNTGKRDTRDADLGWTDVRDQDREKFVEGAARALESEDLATRVKSLGCMTYIALGCWGDTSGVEKETGEHDLLHFAAEWLESQSTKPKFQLDWIVNGVRLLCVHSILQRLVGILNALWDSEQSVSRLPLPTLIKNDIGCVLT